MTPRRSMFLMALFGFSLLLPTSVYADDRIFVEGVMLVTPAEGWGVHEQGKVTVLVREEGRARLEVVRLARVPAADRKAIAELLRARKATTEVEVTKAAALEQHGLKGIGAEATAKDEGAPVRVRVVAIPVGDHAVIVTAIVGEKEGEQLQKEVDGILKSLRPQTASAPAEAARQKDAQALQGKWERTMTATGDGPLGKATRVVTEIKGDKETVTFYDEDGKVLYSFRADFTLSQSGPVRVVTYSNLEFLEGPNKGRKNSGSASYLYRVEKDTLIQVEGMLVGEQYRKQTPSLVAWKRVEEKK